MAQDRTDEPPQLREADRPEEGLPPEADLSARLERLPVGHPSSPYRDDGSRKPTPPDLSKYELPLPDESDSPTGHESSDQPRTAPDGSWDWKAAHLTPEQAHAADRGLAHYREKEGRNTDGNYGEHGLTPAMRRIEAQLDCGSLVADTERFALKDPDRYKEKLAGRVALQPDENVENLVAGIHDGIRYTFEYDDDDYTKGVYRTEDHIKEHGFELVTRKPNWGGEEYKGINSQWQDLDGGIFFEIQFHTHTSWEAKQATHAAYEKLSDPRTSPAEREELGNFQRRITASIPIPPGALEIPYYRKEGS